MSLQPFSLNSQLIGNIQIELFTTNIDYLNMDVLVFPKEKFAFPENEVWFCSRKRPISSNWNFPWGEITGKPGEDNDSSLQPPSLFRGEWVKTTTDKDVMKVAHQMAVIEGNLCMSVDPDAMSSQDFQKFVYLMDYFTKERTLSSRLTEQAIEKEIKHFQGIDRMNEQANWSASGEYDKMDFIGRISIHILKNLMQKFEKPEYAPIFGMHP